MEMYAAIVQIITTVGFPIAMCIALLWYVVKKDAEHKTETSQFVQALNSNTLVLQKLCDKLNIDIEVK